MLEAKPGLFLVKFETFSGLIDSLVWKTVFLYAFGAANMHFSAGFTCMALCVEVYHYVYFIIWCGVEMTTNGPAFETKTPKMLILV